MPPDPEEYEDTDSFMEACMSDPNMQEEYPEESERQDVCFAVWNDAQEGKALTHNSEIADNPPDWGDVDKTRLPANAFANWPDGPGFEEDTKTSWSYPHHHVVGGGELNDDGIYEDGDLYLHKGGLAAARAAAEGARSGEEAPQYIKDHLADHAEDIGMGEENEGKTMRNLEKGRRYRSTIDVVDIEAGKQEDGNGWLEGYAATWDEDQYGESIQKGAFSKTIQEQVPGVPLMTVHRAHGGDVDDVVGTVTEAKEDDIGLWVHAEFDDSELAQETRDHVVSGKVDKMSVGYELIHFEVDRRDGRDKAILKELKLLDVIATMDPVNEATAITDAKETLEAVRTLTERREHLDAGQVADLAQALRETATELDQLAQPEGTAKSKNAAVARHYAAVARRRRMNIYKLTTGAKDNGTAGRTTGET